MRNETPPEPASVRDIVSHRVTFEYESGIRVVGYVTATRPAAGPVQAVTLSAVLLYAGDGSLVGRREELSLVPDLLVRCTWEDARLILEYECGALLEGRRRETTGHGFVELEGVSIHESSGRVLERHDTMTVVPEPLVRYYVSEGPLGREFG